MTVAQTTQLIQLMLNTALLTAVALLWWIVIWLRHSTVTARVQRCSGRPRLPRRLQRQYRLGRWSLGVMYGVLLALLGSLLALSLRTLASGPWLIPLSLLLFTAAVGGLLLSVGFTLVEFCRTSQHQRRIRPRRRLKPALLPPAKRLAS